VHVISPAANVSPLADLEDSVRGSRLIVGDGAMIDSFVKVKFAGGLGDVCIGENTNVNSGCVLYSGNGITIGDDVLIAANCVFAPTNHEYASREIPVRLQRFRPSRGGIVIENDVWIGAGCVLLDGTVIRRGAIVGANSLVRGEVEAYAIVAGSPAKRIGTRGA
jgi:virginiamycin A acetyltransferase